MMRFGIAQQSLFIFCFDAEFTSVIFIFLNYLLFRYCLTSRQLAQFVCTVCDEFFFVIAIVPGFH